jgi:hypothetical protein
MSKYVPDRWIIIKITSEKGSHYRVFASWYGGFAGSDSWKLNSGIMSVTLDDHNYFHFIGSSGSVYSCHKNGYGISNYGANVLKGMSNSVSITIEQLPEQVNPLELNYN